MSVRTRVFVFLGLFICITCAMCEASDEGTGAIVGSLSDPTGAPVSNATVVLTNMDTGQTRSTYTDPMGFFRFYSVPIGRYSVKAEAPGFATVHDQTTVSPANAAFMALVLSAGFGPAPKQKNYVEIKVFYATDRRRSGDKTPATFYSGERKSRDDLDFGTCNVSIPRDHRKGELESPKLWKLQFHQNPNRDVVLLSVLPLAEKKFYAELAGDVQDSGEKKVLVFIHGYNVTFADAARRTAQLAYDLTFQGVPVLYSWPSRASLAGYAADEATIEWVRPHLKTFLEQLAARSNASSIYIVAHSMGNRALIASLNDLVMQHRAQPVPHFREVVLAAPDIDAGVFRQLAANIEGAADRVTLYASSRDKALIASRTVHDYARAGESGTNIVVVKGIDTIDVTALDSGFLGHSYVADNMSVISDLMGLIAGKPADQRMCLSAKKLDALGYWFYGPPGAVGCPVPLPNP